jgi:hypothetical protein
MTDTYGAEDYTPPGQATQPAARTAPATVDYEDKIEPYHEPGASKPSDVTAQHIFTRVRQTRLQNGLQPVPTFSARNGLRYGRLSEVDKRSSWLEGPLAVGACK